MSYPQLLTNLTFRSAAVQLTGTENLGYGFIWFIFSSAAPQLLQYCIKRDISLSNYRAISEDDENVAGSTVLLLPRLVLERVTISPGKPVQRRLSQQPMRRSSSATVTSSRRRSTLGGVSDASLLPTHQIRLGRAQIFWPSCRDRDSSVVTGCVTLVTWVRIQSVAICEVNVEMSSWFGITVEKCRDFAKEIY